MEHGAKGGVGWVMRRGGEQWEEEQAPVDEGRVGDDGWLAGQQVVVPGQQVQVHVQVYEELQVQVQVQVQV